MEAMTLVLDQRRWTREERDALPDDGHRHELLDGALLVTPAPHWRHQWMASTLYESLRGCCPDHLKVMTAPLDIELDESTVVQPDLFIARKSDFAEARSQLLAVPLLVVEVDSPSTHLVDRNMKLPRLERAGCPSFWILDPEVPSLTAWDLVDGSYVEVAHVEGDQSWTATQPFVVTITPSALLA